MYFCIRPAFAERIFIVLFRFLGQLFGKVTFAVAMHLRPILILAEHVHDIIVVYNIFRYRPKGLDQHYKGNGKDYKLFHGCKYKA